MSKVETINLKVQYISYSLNLHTQSDSKKNKRNFLTEMKFFIFDKYKLVVKCITPYNLLSEKYLNRVKKVAPLLM